MDIYEKFDNRNREAVHGGRVENIAKQKAGGKHTARERINILLDDDTFVEVGRFVLHDCHDYDMENKGSHEKTCGLCVDFCQSE